MLWCGCNPAVDPGHEDTEENADPDREHQEGPGKRLHRVLVEEPVDWVGDQQHCGLESSEHTEHRTNFSWFYALNTDTFYYFYYVDNSDETS